MAAAALKTVEAVVATQLFDDFVREHRLSLLKFAMVLTGDLPLSEDVVGDALARAYEDWTRIAFMDRPVAYLRRPIVNGYLSTRRRWARDLSRFFARDSLEETAATDERQAMVTRLAKLPARQRSVVVLRYYADLDDDEIAQLLGCSAATVRSHAARALRALRVEIASEGVPDAHLG
jgi:RNA polymerase sigma-70 factor (sigma-E family)